ncbi:sulfatase-like hydrolase/transferase [Akkermansiaceae bacterium]|jgi:N-acetylglucosamine-6-sulfatase|nr:sulfatase-like hydrolase/transferase [Akkermansiaceae bacterium]
MTVRILLSLALSLPALADHHEGTHDSLPNVLCIMSDDYAAHGISAYGSRLAEIAPTPNIDRLAEEGALFKNAFCTNAICSPSRACVLTGQYNHTNGPSISRAASLRGNRP